MTRLAAALVIASLATLFAMLADTQSGTAIVFSFVGMPLFGLAIAVYAYAIWRPVHLTEDERTLHRLAFETLEPRDFKELVALGTWKDAAAGDTLIQSGQQIEHVQVLLSGVVAFRVGPDEVARLGAGQLLGASIALTESESWGDAVVVEPARYLDWPLAALRPELERRRGVQSALRAVVSLDLAEKVRTLSQPKG